MRIVRLAIHEFKGIKEADFEPGHVMMLTGPKGSGKSSVLDAVIAAVNGGGSNLIRVGADKAIIFIDMAELELTRTITARGGNQPARIRIANGMSPTKPQQFLAELLGALAFNPLEFWRLKPVDQREYLLQMTPVVLSEEEAAEVCGGELPPIDYSGHGLDVAARLQEHFEGKRTAAKAVLAERGNAVVAIAAQVPEGFGDRLGENPDATAEEWEEDRVAIMKRLHEYNTAREVAEQTAAQRGELAAQKADIEAVIHETQGKLKGAEGDIAGYPPITSLDRREEELLGELEQVRYQIKGASMAISRRDSARERLENNRRLLAQNESLAGKLSAAEANPEAEERCRAEIDHLTDDLLALDKWHELVDARARMQEQEAEVERLDKQVKYWLREAPANLLKRADLPIPGLSFDDGRVLIDGVDINDRSDGEKLLTAVDIAKRLNAGAKLRVVFCDGLEKLDPKTRAEFIALAEADEEYQFIMTCTTAPEGLPGSVVMEGGRVKERRGEENKLRLVT